LTDNLFRRLIWFLIPVIAMGALGVVQAMNTLEVYHAAATLSTSNNPLLPEQPATGAGNSFWESPSAGTTRIINEQLQTDSFLTAVAEQAGLGEALEAGLVELAVVRASVWASSNGDSILSVHAEWADGQTAYQLAAAIVSQYQAFLTETASRNATEAETFYTAQLETLAIERDAAEKALTDFAADLPTIDDDENYPIETQIQLDRLEARLTTVESKISAAELKIDEAQLSGAQLATEAGQSYKVIDDPTVPSAPQSTLVKRGMLVIAFMLLGVVISAAALLVTTVLDQSVSSTSDLLAMAGVVLVATVPPVRIGAPADRTRRPARKRKPAAAGRAA
jgi:uncharacterized protein involved in exopolysaccharide biosynthesis